MSLCMKIRKVYRKLMIIKMHFYYFFGFSGGLSVGAGYVAFLTVLGNHTKINTADKNDENDSNV